MKAKKKNNYLALLLILVCSLCAANSYANIYVQHNKTKQDKTTEGTEPTETKEGADATEAKEAAKPTEAKEAANPTGATGTQEQLKFSGSWKMTMGYNATNHPAGKALSPASIALESDDASDSTSPTPFKASTPKDPFSTSASATLALKKTILWEGKPVKLNVGMAIGQGSSSTKLSRVSAEFKSLVLGLQGSNFGNSDLDPSCIGGGPNSDVGNKALQLRFNLKQFLFSGLSLALSFEEAPRFKISEKYNDKLNKEQKKLKKIQSQQSEHGEEDIESNERKTCEEIIEDCKSRLSYKPLGHQPALAVSLRYKYPESRGHFYLGLLARLMQYQDTRPNQPQIALHLASGICAGTKLNVWPERTTIKLQGVVGHGIGEYIGDLSALAKEDNTAYVVVKNSTDYNLHILNAGGGYLAVEHHWIPKLLRSTLVFSGLSIINGDDRDNDCYKAGLYGSISLSYHPTEEFHLGGELAGGQKICVDRTKSGKAYGVRIVASFRF